MRTVEHLLAVHLVHLVLLVPAVLFGLGVLVFSRRRPAWDTGYPPSNRSDPPGDRRSGTPRAEPGLLEMTERTMTEPTDPPAEVQGGAVQGGARPGDAMQGGGAADGRSLRVLFAEDNTVNQKVGVILLTRLGHSTDVVVNGADAVAAAHASLADGHPYDVVLMDVQMPIMDGLEATRRIRADIPARHQPRIFAMTASALVEDRQACAAAGMDGYLMKPVRRQDLEHSLRPDPPENPQRELVRAEPADSTGVSAGAGRDRAGSEGRPSELLVYSLRDRLAELRGVGDPSGDALVEHLIASYLTRAPAFLDRLAAAVDTADRNTVGTETHGLAGMSANIGARTVPAMCSALSAAAQAGEWSSVRVVLRRLGSEIAGVRTALDQVRAGA